jgi:hypothetical protein
MRHVMICCVAGLAILWAGNVGSAKDRTERREQRKITREDKQGHQKLRAMTPQQRKAIAVRVRKAIDKDLASLRQMRETAVGEKATGTVAEIDKAIAAKEKQSKRLTGLGQKPKAGRKGEVAKGNQSQGKGKAGHRKQKKSEK